MHGYRSYNASKNGLYLPIVFLSYMREEYEAFMENYDPNIGFLVTKNKKNYFIYLGGYQYKLDYFEDRGIPIYFAAKNRDAISQKNTVDLAKSSIRITGLERDYFFMQDQRSSFSQAHPHVVFSNVRERLDKLLDGKQLIEAEPPAPLWKELLEVSEKKREFSSHFLIQWPYAHFTQNSKVEDGYLYDFQLAAPDKVIAANEKRFDVFRQEHGLSNEDDASDQSLEALREQYINTFSVGTIIEIPLSRESDSDGKPSMLYGTVRRLELPGVTHTQDGEPLELEEDFYAQDNYFNRPWTMVLSFKDDATVSVSDISTHNSVIIERVSTDYKHYKSTLNIMSDSATKPVWSVAEQVIVTKNIPPFPKGKPLNFFSDRLNDNQKQAIQLAVDAPDFCLIQGPPGSGKTTIITEMIRHFIDRRQRVLVCSKGNLAVDNVLEKWIQENQGRSDCHQCIRLGDHFKLDFLKDFTPANITAGTQKNAYSKTQEERDFLTAQVQQQIDLVENHKATLMQMTNLCILVCQLTDTLSRLCDAYKAAVAHYKRWAGTLPQKAESASLAYSAAYHGLMLPCYQLLRSEDAPSSLQMNRFDQCYQILQQQLPAIIAGFKPGFFSRLFLGKPLNQWDTLEKELQEQYAAFLAMQMQGNKLLRNPLTTVDMLQLPDLGNTPAPRQLLDAAQHLKTSLSEFAQRENIRLERIQAVLNDWLIELGSGVSTSLEKSVVLNSIPVIGSTCMGIMSDSDFSNATYDVVIVDEAGQIPIFDILVPIIKARKVVLIGDHLQLPPMDENDFAHYYATQKTGADTGEAFEKCQQEIAQWYNVSLFETLYRAPDLDCARTMLNTQYRMHPDISQFISDNFYNGEYLAGVTAEMRSLRIAGFDKPIYFYDTCNLLAEERAETDHKPGYSNKTEAELLSDILTKLILAIRDDNYANPNVVMRSKEDGSIIGYDIGVISGYKKQVKAIYNLTRQKLEQHMSDEEAQMHMDRFMISSVDSFQGRDNQIILFSMTRSNPHGKIGFLKDVRRLNVAMTRAKSLLIMVGDSTTLTACDAVCAHDSTIPVSQIYKKLTDYCKEKGYYHPLKGGDSHDTE